MRIWAVVENSAVVNTVAWDGGASWSPPENVELVELEEGSHVSIGWDYIDGVFVDNRPVDESVDGVFFDVQPPGEATITPNGE